MAIPFAAIGPFIAKALPYALSAASAGAGFLGAKKKNKKMPGIPNFPSYSGSYGGSYSGLRPPGVSFLRPVESEISDILMKRARGEDVGFDPRRLQELKNVYDINAAQRREQEIPEIYNQLSGTGQSRNLAARDALLGRYEREQARERNKYFSQYDIEDLARRNEERDINTARLQNLNTFNFGQENARANFDKSIYDLETGNQLAQYGLKNQAYQQRESPLGSALEAGLTAFGVLRQPQLGNITAGAGPIRDRQRGIFDRFSPWANTMIAQALARRSQKGLPLLNTQGI